MAAAQRGIHRPVNDARNAAIVPPPARLCFRYIQAFGPLSQAAMDPCY
jgi:hypothetical protein